MKRPEAKRPAAKLPAKRPQTKRVVDKTPFSFLKLPQSIRLIVCRLVTGASEKTRTYITHRSHKPSQLFRDVLRLSHVNRQLRDEVLSYVFGMQTLSISIYDLEWFLALFAEAQKHVQSIVLRDFSGDYTEKHQSGLAAEWTQGSLEKLVEMGKEYGKLKHVKIEVTRRSYVLKDDLAAMELDNFRNLETFKLVDPGWWRAQDAAGGNYGGAKRTLKEKEEEIRKVVCKE